MDRPAVGPHHREIRLALRPREPLQRRRGGLERLVAVLLPAVQAQPLVEVPLGVEEPDPDQRHAEIRRRLAVVPGQDPEAAGVDRHRVVQAELRAEVRDRPRAEGRVLPRVPGVRVRGVLVEGRHHAVVELQEMRVARALRQALRRHPAQLLQRVVARAVPQRPVEGAEQGTGVPVPRPEQVGRDLEKPSDPLRQVGHGVGGTGHSGTKYAQAGGERYLTREGGRGLGVACRSEGVRD